MIDNASEKRHCNFWKCTEGKETWRRELKSCIWGLDNISIHKVVIEGLKNRLKLAKEKSDEFQTKMSANEEFIQELTERLQKSELVKTTRKEDQLQTESKQPNITKEFSSKIEELKEANEKLKYIVEIFKIHCKELEKLEEKVKLSTENKVEVIKMSLEENKKTDIVRGSRNKAKYVYVEQQRKKDLQEIGEKRNQR